MVLAIFFGCTSRFVSDLVENSEDRCVFSRDEAHLIELQSHLVGNYLTEMSCKNSKYIKSARLDFF